MEYNTLSFILYALGTDIRKMYQEKAIIFLIYADIYNRTLTK